MMLADIGAATAFFIGESARTLIFTGIDTCLSLGDFAGNKG